MAIKITCKEIKMPLGNTGSMLRKELEAKNIFSGMELKVINNPIDPKKISKPTNNSIVKSVIKAGVVFFSILGGYYFSKTTKIFSYFGLKEKNSNSKDMGSKDIREVKKGENALGIGRNLKVTKRINTPLVNQIPQNYRTEDSTVKFKEVKVEEFKNFQKEKKENVGMRRFSSRRSIVVQNPIPDQSAFVGLPFELTIDGTSVFSSSDVVFLQPKNIPTWLNFLPFVPSDSPTFKGSYGMSEPVSGITVYENYAYVAAYYLGLYIIDISDPSNPTIKGSYNMPRVYGFDISGNNAYMAKWGGLHIADITDPANITFKGSYDTPDGASGVDVSGNYVYVTTV